ncbi:MAG: hypothetical protein OCU18_03930 [Candidatus Syntrophoarchaeum sp.]|nr:hypothetical protein [Candidatus Syntrophoarchaeum sp.]
MANTTYRTLYSKVLFRLGMGEDGRALFAAREAVNDAQKYIARVTDFEELKVLDTDNASTAAGTKTYHLTDDWGLTRPKDLITLRYMDEGSSGKLVALSARELDEKLPYVESIGETVPKWYTRRGNNIDLVPVPSEAKSIYIFYSQWPLVLSDDSDETSYENIDDVIVALASDIAATMVRKETQEYGTKLLENWPQRAREYLGLAVREHNYKPDMTYIAQPFGTGNTGFSGEPWKDPFVKGW